MSSECINITMFTMNRTSSIVLNHKSPFEIMYDKIPNYVDFRVFGSLCYASTNKHKFSPKVTYDVFLVIPKDIKVTKTS